MKATMRPMGANKVREGTNGAHPLLPGTRTISNNDENETCKGGYDRNQQNL